MNYSPGHRVLDYSFIAQTSSRQFKKTSPFAIFKKINIRLYLWVYDEYRQKTKGEPIYGRKKTPRELRNAVTWHHDEGDTNIYDFFDPYIMPDQVIDFLLRCVVCGPNRVTEPKIFALGIFNFRNIFVLQNLKHCNSLQRRVSHQDACVFWIHTSYSKRI